MLLASDCFSRPDGPPFTCGLEFCSNWSVRAAPPRRVLTLAAHGGNTTGRCAHVSTALARHQGLSRQQAAVMLATSPCKPTLSTLVMCAIMVQAQSC